MKKKRRDRGSTESVLSRQKPKTPRAKRTSRGKRVGYALAGVGIASLAIFVATHRPHPAPVAKKVPVIAAQDWQLSLKLNDDTPLSDKAQADLLGTALKNIGQGSHDDLDHVAHAIQNLGDYADVRLVKLAPNRVAISVRKREPVFCVDADRMRLVSSLGDVYSEVNKDRGDICPGPILTGLYEGKVQLALNDDLTVILDPESRTLIREALTLLTEGKALGFHFDQLQIRKYRGFFGNLNGSGTEVALGRAPFTGKLEKLRGILEKLALKQEQAQRIELDYQGKAFVKLKKM